MELTRRKKTELNKKLESLQQEWADWRDQSRATRPLEKHHSQIHRVTVRLEALVQEIVKELNLLADDSPQLLSRARELEGLMLEVHRVWEFFRSKLSLRSLPWFSKYLVAADDLAWDCYRAAQLKLSGGHLPPHHVKEPPLVFFNGGSSPFTQARNEAFEAEVVPNEELKTGAARQVLRALPIPVIGVPWFQVQHLPEALVIAHEVGHDVESDFRLTRELEQALEAGFEEAGTDAARRGAWRSWLGEIFADIYGVLACGPAFVGTLMDFLATDVGQTERAWRQAPDWGFYPTDYLRIMVNLEVLRQRQLTRPEKDLRAEWGAVYRSHAMGDYEADIEAVVKAIITKPFAAFGGDPLPKVISFDGEDHNAAETDALRIIDGRTPQTNNVRILFAAASLAFRLNPETYNQMNVHKLVLDTASSIREGGVRSSRVLRNGSLSSLDKEDKAEGAALFGALRNTPQRL